MKKDSRLWQDWGERSHMYMCSRKPSAAVFTYSKIVGRGMGVEVFSLCPLVVVDSLAFRLMFGKLV